MVKQFLERPSLIIRSGMHEHDRPPYRMWSTRGRFMQVTIEICMGCGDLNSGGATFTWPPEPKIHPPVRSDHDKSSGFTPLPSVSSRTLFMVNRTPARNSVHAVPDSRPSISSGADRPPHPGHPHPVTTEPAVPLTCKSPMLPAPEGPDHRTRLCMRRSSGSWFGDDWFGQLTLMVRGNGPTPLCRSRGSGACSAAFGPCIEMSKGVSAAALDRSPLAGARGPSISQFVPCRPGDPAGFDQPTSPAGPSCFAE